MYFTSIVSRRALRLLNHLLSNDLQLVHRRKRGLWMQMSSSALDVIKQPTNLEQFSILFRRGAWIQPQAYMQYLEFR